MKSLLKEFVNLVVEKRMREADVSDGSRVKWGSKKHIKDLERRISDLEMWRSKQKRGSEQRANYSRLISRLKGELASVRRSSQKLSESFEGRYDIYRGGKEIEKQREKEERMPLKGPRDYKSVIEKDREETIEEMQGLPEYASVDSFVSYAFDDERETFDDMELQAIARNTFEVQTPGQFQVRGIKDELSSYGLKFVPRQPVKGVRGARSNPHGTHPFAGSGAGGSGFSSGGLGLGTGPGAIGGKTRYDASSPGALPMGSRRR